MLDDPNAFVRPPYGETSPATDADIRKTELDPVYWTTDTCDWEKPPVDVIVKRALKVRPEDIILLHDGHENTLKAVPRVVAELRSRGMCPGLLAKTDKTVVSPYRNRKFNVIAVSPKNDSGVSPPGADNQNRHGSRHETQKVVLLVPAHNEEVGIVATMESVEAQTLSPDRRIVVCDNCTDATPALARARAGWRCGRPSGTPARRAARSTRRGTASATT